MPKRDMKTSTRNRLWGSLFVILLAFASLFSSFSQEQKHNPSSDSTAVRAPAFETLSLFPPPAATPSLSLKSNLDGFDGFLSRTPILAGSEYGLGFLRLSLAAPIPPPWDSQQKLSLATCWTNELRRQEEYRTFRMILGSIQAGGAAYLAYRYLKKYGLK
jgi:hypothetical protein